MLVFNVVILILVLAIILSAVVKVRNNRLCSDSDYLIKRKIGLSTGYLLEILSKYKLDETTNDSFIIIRNKFVEKINNSKGRLSWKKQLEIEDAISIGLVSYSDLILLYSYTLEINDEEMFAVYRFRYKSIADRYLEAEFIPTKDFE